MAKSPYSLGDEIPPGVTDFEPTILAYGRASPLKIVERIGDNYVGTDKIWNDDKIRGKCFHTLLNVLEILASKMTMNQVKSGNRSAGYYFYVVMNSKITKTSLTDFEKMKQNKNAQPSPAATIQIPILNPVPLKKPEILKTQETPPEILVQPKRRKTSATKRTSVKKSAVVRDDGDESTLPAESQSEKAKLTLTQTGPTDVLLLPQHPIRSRITDANHDKSPTTASSLLIEKYTHEEDSDNPKSIFGSTKSILQKYIQKSDISQIDLFDQNHTSFLNKRWLEGLNDPHLPTHWNPIASIYSVLLYVHQVLEWPLVESRVIVHYRQPAFRLSAIADKIFKHCNIEDRLAESSPIIQLLVWCILSMKTYGIIRPIIFKASTENGGRLSDFCAYRHRRDCILIYATWPFRVDSDKLYWIVDQTKLKDMSLKSTFLSDLHIDKKPKKVLKDIPGWVYKLCGAMQ